MKNANKSYSLIHYHFTGWPDYNVVEAGRLFDLIEFINDHRKREFSSNPRTKLIESNPTVVHCRLSCLVRLCVEIIIVFDLVRVLDERELI